MEHDAQYEVPALTEVGGFAELTLGGSPAGESDGGPAPFDHNWW